MEEYFRAKWELLMEGDTYGDMIAAYPAYWGGLRRLELVILIDARVLGRIWPGQIIGRDPQIEEWAADTDPDVGALQKLLSNLDNQRAVWSQIWALRGVDSPPRVPDEGTAEGRDGGGIISGQAGTADGR